MPENTAPLPDFTRWPSFPFEGDMRVKRLAAPVEVEPPRSGEDAGECVACKTPDEAYIWVSERWRVRAMDRPSGLPMVLILECRSHLDLGDLPNLLAAELGVMTVRMERAIRSLDGVARVHVNRWGDGSAHLHMWFLARPYGRLQLRGTFLSLWDDILPVIPESQWRENLALVAAWLAEFGGQANAEPAHIQWQSPSTINVDLSGEDGTEPAGGAAGSTAETPPPWRPTSLSDVEDPSDAKTGGNSRKSPTATGSAAVTAGGPASADVRASADMRASAIDAERPATVTGSATVPVGASASRNGSSTEHPGAEGSAGVHEGETESASALGNGPVQAAGERRDGSGRAGELRDDPALAPASEPWELRGGTVQATSGEPWSGNGRAAAAEGERRDETATGRGEATAAERWTGSARERDEATMAEPPDGSRSGRGEAAVGGTTVGEGRDGRTATVTAPVATAEGGMVPRQSPAGDDLI